jgi:hypothetical protein
VGDRVAALRAFRCSIHSIHWSPYGRVGAVNAVSSLRTLSPGGSLRPSPLAAFNPETPRRLSTPLLTPLNASTPISSLVWTITLSGAVPRVSESRLGGADGDG